MLRKPRIRYMAASILLLKTVCILGSEMELSANNKAVHKRSEDVIDLKDWN